MNKLPVYIALVGAVIAFGIFVYVTNAPIYAGTEPSACNNCHVMDSEYENWYHAAHARSATCAECHLPHQNVISYYMAKAQTGMHDVYVYSTGQTPDTIRAKAETKKIIQANCIRCHRATVENIMAGPPAFERNCWDCHRSVAHGYRGISIVPYQDSTLYPTK
jgi:cytochrome c nitrite reductase small subunit